MKPPFIIEPLPRKAFMAIAEECKRNVSEFREIKQPMMPTGICGVITGKSGEKYNVQIYKNIVRVDWGIQSVSFDDDASVAEGKVSEVEKLYDYMDANITRDEIDVEMSSIKTLFQEFGPKHMTREEYMRTCTSDELAEILTKLILSDKRFRIVHTAECISKEPNYEMKMWLKEEYGKGDI